MNRTTQRALAERIVVMLEKADATPRTIAQWGELLGLTDADTSPLAASDVLPDLVRSMVKEMRIEPVPGNPALYRALPNRGRPVR